MPSTPLVSHPVRVFILLSFHLDILRLFETPVVTGCFSFSLTTVGSIAVAMQMLSISVLFFLDQIQTVLCMMKSKRNLMCVCVCVCVFSSFVAMATAGCCPGWRVWRSNKSQRRSPCCQSREDWTQTRWVQTLSSLSSLFLQTANCYEQKRPASNLFLHFDQRKMVALWNRVRRSSYLPVEGTNEPHPIMIFFFFFANIMKKQWNVVEDKEAKQTSEQRERVM